MKYFPIFLNLKNKPVLIVGTGPDTLCKIDQIQQIGANVKYISNSIPSATLQYLKEAKIDFTQKDFDESDLDGIWLVISTSEDAQLNKKVFDAASSRNIFVNVVDVTDLCTFIFPAIINEGDVNIAISTSGKSPALAQKIKKEISHIIGKEYGYLAELMGKTRPLIINKIKGRKKRATLFQKLVNSELLDLLKNGKKDEAKEFTYKMISEKINISK